MSVASRTALENHMRCEVSLTPKTNITCSHVYMYAKVAEIIEAQNRMMVTSEEGAAGTGEGIIQGTHPVI